MKILIVGGGITGTALALRLLEKGVQVTILDRGENECSAVAAGILNPLVFRRMHLSWRVDDFFPAAKQFYQKYAPLAWNDLVIRRLFPSDQERGFWEEKQDLPVFRDYMQRLTDDDLKYEWPTNTHGTGLVKTAGWVNPRIFFLQIREAFSEQLNFITSSMNYSEIDLQTGNYEGEIYDTIVFAEGHGLKSNPWFGNLPLIPTKGELLTISSDHLPEAELLNRKCFVLPIGERMFRVGSTYDFNTTDTSITEKNAGKIRDNLKSITSDSYQVLDQQAGIRPTVPDRRPLLGRHPDFPRLAVANGMGTKGYLIAPLLMKEFADHLLDNSPLDSDCNINRYIK